MMVMLFAWSSKGGDMDFIIAQHYLSLMNGGASNIQGKIRHRVDR